MAGNFNLTTMAKHMYYILNLGPAIHSSECKTQYKIIIYYFDISDQPGRKRFVLDRFKPIKVVS